MRYEVKWNLQNKKKFEDTPNKIMYFIARKTLDMTIPAVPWNTGRMRRSTSAFRGLGVVPEGDNKYIIGSDTEYARKVYLYNDATTHWTTPGTHSHWFSRTWKEKHDVIEQMAVKKYELK